MFIFNSESLNDKVLVVLMVLVLFFAMALFLLTIFGGAHHGALSSVINGLEIAGDSGCVVCVGGG